MMKDNKVTTIDSVQYAFSKSVPPLGEIMSSD